MLFSIRKQDVCRFYREDFWGELKKVKRFRAHVNRCIFGRTRRKRGVDMSRFEVIKMDNKKFKRRRRLSKYGVRLYNFEKARLYFMDMSEYAARAFLMIKVQSRVAPSGNAVQRSVSIQDRLGLRMDHLLFMAGWGATLPHVRQLFRRGTLLINGHIPNRYDTVPVAGDIIRPRAVFRPYFHRILANAKFRRLRNRHLLNSIKARKYFGIWRKFRWHTRYWRVAPRRLIKRKFLRSKPVRQHQVRYSRFKARRALVTGMRYAKFRFSKAFYPRRFLTSKDSRPRARFLTVQDAAATLSGVGFPNTKWKTGVQRHLLDQLRLDGLKTLSIPRLQSEFPQMVAGMANEFARITAGLLRDTTGETANLFFSPSRTPFLASRVFAVLANLAKQHTPGHLVNYPTIITALKQYRSFLRRMASSATERSEFADLFRLLYNRRMISRIRFNRILNDLTNDPYSVIGHLPTPMRRKLFRMKLGYILRAYTQATVPGFLFDNLRAGKFYPVMEEGEIAGRLRKFRLRFSPDVKPLISAVTRQINKHRWLDFSVQSLLHLTLQLRDPRLNTGVSASRKNIKLLTRLLPRVLPGQRFSSKLLSRVRRYVSRLVQTTFSAKRSTRVSAGLRRAEAKRSARGRKQLAAKLKYFNKQFKRRLREGLAPAYSPTMKLKRKLRLFSKVVAPLARKSKQKRYVTLLVRRFGNLMVSYRLMRIYYLGFRRIRGRKVRFYYFPCKFSIKVLLRFFGGPDLGPVKKLDATFINKPYFPFSLPRVPARKPVAQLEAA